MLLAADVVDAGEHHVVALDLHHDRGVQALAVELAERHREVGGMAVPADGELGAERDLGGALRTAYRNLPFAVARRNSWRSMSSSRRPSEACFSARPQ